MSAHTGNDLDSGTGFIATVKAQLQALLVPLFGPDNDAASVLGHFCEYMVLGALTAHAFSATPTLNLRQPLSAGLLFVCALIFGSFYGATDEIHQIFVPGRVCDLADWITDTLGCAVGILGYLGIKAWRKRGF